MYGLIGVALAGAMSLAACSLDAGLTATGSEQIDVPVETSEVPIEAPDPPQEITELPPDSINDLPVEYDDLSEFGRMSLTPASHLGPEALVESIVETDEGLVLVGALWPAGERSEPALWRLAETDGVFSVVDVDTLPIRDSDSDGVGGGIARDGIQLADGTLAIIGTVDSNLGTEAAVWSVALDGTATRTMFGDVGLLGNGDRILQDGAGVQWVGSALPLAEAKISGVIVMPSSGRCTVVARSGL